MTKLVTILSLGVLSLAVIILGVHFAWAMDSGQVTMALLTFVTIQLVAGVAMVLAGHLGEVSALDKISKL
jgi:uncharacterized membrane protein